MSGTGITVQPGWDVYGIDGEKVGTVREVDPTYFRLRTGGIFGKDLFVPMSAIEEPDEAMTRVNLTVSKSDVGNMGWEHRPPTTTATAGSGTSRGAWDDDGDSPAMRDRGRDVRTRTGVAADAMKRADAEDVNGDLRTREPEDETLRDA